LGSTLQTERKTLDVAWHDRAQRAAHNERSYNGRSTPVGERAGHQRIHHTSARACL